MPYAEPMSPTTRAALNRVAVAMAALAEAAANVDRDASDAADAFYSLGATECPPSSAHRAAAYKLADAVEVSADAFASARVIAGRMTSDAAFGASGPRAAACAATLSLSISVDAIGCD